METLPRGTAFDGGDIDIPDAPAAAPIVIERGLGECPHGFWYEASKGGTPLLVTVLDPLLVAQADVRAHIVRDVEKRMRVQHKNLLPCYGLGTSRSSGVRVYIVEAWPAGGTVREFVKQRRIADQPLDDETAYTLVAHVCNALVQLHDVMVHGYVTADTVYVSDAGRIFVSAAGVGPSLTYARGFARFRAGGLLPNVPPEQAITPPQLVPATDVFGVAALYLHLLTEQSLAKAGQPLEELSFHGSDPVRRCLQKATHPDPERRQPDIATFKSELGSALRTDGVRAQTLAGSELASALGTSPLPPPPPSSAALPDPYAAPPVVAPGYPPGYPPPYPPAGYYPPPYPPVYPYPPGYPAYYPMPPGYPPHPSMPGHPAMPAHPMPPPPMPVERPLGPVRAPTPASSGDLDELDRAMRKIESADGASARELTVDPAGIEDEPAAIEPGTPIRTSGSASSSSLGLDLGAYDEARARLSTIDGQDDDAPAIEGGGSGPYFGSFTAPDESDQPEIDEHGERVKYFVVREDAEYGPYSHARIAEMIGSGNIDGADRLRNASSGATRFVVDTPGLRRFLGAASDAKDREPAATLESLLPGHRVARPLARGAAPLPHAAPAAPSPAPRGRGVSTMAIVALVLVAFAVAGFFVLSP